MARQKTDRKVRFWDAPEVRAVVDEVLPEFHSSLQSLELVCKFVGRRMKYDRGVHVGKMEIIGGERASDREGIPCAEIEEEMPPQFLQLKMSKPDWDKMTETERVAAVDHYLARAWVNEDGKAVYTEPDVVEYRAVLNRRGFWNEHLKTFGECVVLNQSQLTLNISDETIQELDAQAEANEPTREERRAQARADRLAAQALSDVRAEQLAAAEALNASAQATGDATEGEAPVAAQSTNEPLSPVSLARRNRMRGVTGPAATAA